MTSGTQGGEAPVWLGREAFRQEAFAGGGLWIGRHAVDRDILVFDPAEAAGAGEVIALYSLTQHRTRSFPRAAVADHIRVVTDAETRSRAESEYARRAELRAAHRAEQAAERASRLQEQRQGVLDAHRRYLEALGLAYEGERETGGDHRPGRRTKCHRCGIALDDFVGMVCTLCEGVLCSCGACACTGRPR